MLNEVIKSQIDIEEGKKRKEKPLLENVNAQKEELIKALCKVDYPVSSLGHLFFFHL